LGLRVSNQIEPWIPWSIFANLSTQLLPSWYQYYGHSNITESFGRWRRTTLCTSLIGRANDLLFKLLLLRFCKNLSEAFISHSLIIPLLTEFWGTAIWIVSFGMALYVSLSVVTSAISPSSVNCVVANSWGTVLVACCCVGTVISLSNNTLSGIETQLKLILPPFLFKCPFRKLTPK